MKTNRVRGPSNTAHSTIITAMAARLMASWACVPTGWLSRARLATVAPTQASQRNACLTLQLPGQKIPRIEVHGSTTGFVQR